MGGGIRKQDDIQRYIDIGINKVIVGTKALSDKEFIVNLDKDLKEQVIIDIAIKDNNLAIHGWNESSKLSIEEFLNYLENNNIKEGCITDVSKDGMLSGTNLDLIKKICDLTHIPIIASGGVTSLADINNLISIMDKGISGVIIGKPFMKNLSKLRTYCN